ncbi:CD109 antigen-like isoform X2 [Cimex lectularius]|uniref:TEP1-F n=1 Tax=Cimex lectularius TaxID=79782 RepID=A0A8I6RJN7_CIMLE|nr:CD109 antigen-like isoform X2 [Cimex lectularius]
MACLSFSGFKIYSRKTEIVSGIATAVAMLLLWVLFLYQTLVAANAKGYYTVVAPNVIRPNSDFHVAVTTSDINEPVTFVAEISGQKFSGGTFYLQETANVRPYSSEVMTFKVNNELSGGNYNLTIRSEGAFYFKNTTTLRFSEKSISVLIQTDKAMYKPGDKVMFRALFLNRYMKPIREDVNLYLNDGDGNRVKQWNNITLPRGLFSSEFELSSAPVLGDWRLVATVNGQKFSKSFEVAEYVLPKFEVSIDLPDYVTFKDSKVAATIRAKYTYGKPVKGEATIAVYSDTFSDIIQPIFNPPVRKTVPIDGKALAEFDVVKELNLPDDFEREIKFDVIIKEDLTGRKQNKSAQMTIRKNKYKFEMFDTSTVFKPGLEHKVFIKLVHHDETPVIDNTNPIKIKSSYSYSDEDYNTTEYKVPDNGVLELTFFPPLNATVIQIEGSYLDVKEHFPIMSAAISLNNISVKASVLTQNPQVNQNIEVEVTSTNEMTYVMYQVIGRGDIIHANTINFPPSKSTTIRFLATYAMAPVAHVVVQFISPQGEMIADVVDIELKEILQNFVKMDLSAKRIEPGNKVDLRILTRPNSLVGLLAVDQSVLLLKSGNDLTESQVIDELRNYDQSIPSLYDDVHMAFKRKRRFAFRSYDRRRITTFDTFEHAGVVVLTNSEVNNAQPWRFFRGMYLEDQEEMFDMSTLDAGFKLRAFASAAGAAIPYEPSIRVRSKFPETWIWDELDSGISGRTSITKTVPDTITSWIISGFSLDQVYGLGLSEAPQKLTVFRPFFVTTNLPYSIIRGEMISIPVVVFNYMDKDITAEVILENSGQFEFSDYSNDVIESPKLELFRRKHINVGRQSGASTSFLITPKEVGYIDLKITAKSPLAGDAILKKLLVKPEGETLYKNKAVLLDFKTNKNIMKSFKLDIPVNVVPDSEYIEVAAVGDIFGPSMSNLESLIKMPFGCGEQNMLNFVPNIVVLEYLKNTNQLSKAIENKCLKYMEKGYQRELTYKHPDGSFSAFGKSDRSGSTWLTAFVAKSFIQARHYIDIDNQVINDALIWLANQQAANGSFPEVGVVNHKDMQGGASNGVALTAYVLTAFIEAQSFNGQNRNTINKAISYLHENMNGNDDYANAVLAYSFMKASHPSANTLLNFLNKNAKTQDDKKWWQRTSIETKNPNEQNTNAIDVEMTSYAMLAYLEGDLIADAISIMKWLITQQNDGGGFASTQDTILALTALGKLASKIHSDSNDAVVKFTYKEGMSSDITVNKGNNMIVQKVVLPKKTREVNITAEGSGFIIAQVSYRYNVNVTGAWPLFTLDPQVDKNSDNNHLQLSICSGFTGGNESNMAVMEVSLPSGYTVDSDSLPSLEISQHVKRVETKDGDTVVVLYFDKMVAKEYCPTVSAFRTHRVARQRPVPVTIYDYYDQSRKARVFYEAITSSPCDICEGDDCRVCSGSNAGSRSDEKSVSSSFTPSLYLLTISIISTYLLLR